MKAVADHQPYLAYLIRMWLVQNHSQQIWRCSLENVQTGQRHGFANLKAMCEFLSEKISLVPEGGGVDDEIVD